MSGSPCCPSGSWGNPPADSGQRTDKGVFENIAGVNCYVTGAIPAKVVILSFSDVFPCLMERKREVCDQLAEAIPGSQVVAPDFFKGKSIMELPPPNAGKFRSIASLLLSMPRIFYRLRVLHTWSSLGPMLEGLVEELRAKHPNAYFLCYGYCFGGYVVCKVCSYMGFSAGLSYHPSPQICKMQPSGEKQTLQELASAVRCPILLLPAGNDPDLVKAGGDFVKWLPDGSSSHTYENMKHGYMSRAASDDSALAKMMGGSVEDISAAQADALQRTVDFFKSAMERPAVLVAQAPKPKSGARGGYWLALVLGTMCVSIAVVAAKRRARL